MKKLIYIHIAAVIFIICLPSCEKSKFKPDKADKRLPAYTEKGYNIAGALINNQTWRGRFEYNFPAPATYVILIKSSPDSVVFHLNGELIDEELHGLDITIVVKEKGIIKINDLMKFNNRQFILDGKNNYAYVYEWNNTFKLRNIISSKGVFYIKKVQERTNITEKSPNGDYHPFILSGVFNIEFPGVNITDGRFDVIVGRNFNKY